MKKVIALVVFVLSTAILLGSYYGMGFLTERTLVKNINVLNQSKEIKVSLDHYKRNWFHSDAVLQWEILIPSKVIDENGKKIFKPSKKYHISMPIIIYHGPIIFQKNRINFGFAAAGSHLTLPKQYMEAFDELYTVNSTKPSLDLDIYVNYLNHTSLILTAPKFKLISKDNDTNFEWLGMQSIVNVTPNLQHVQGLLSIEGLTWIQDKMQSVLSKIESEYDLYKSDLGLYTGDAKLYLPSILVTREGNKLIEVSNFNLISTAAINDNLFNSSLKSSLDRIFINNEVYRSCSFDLSFNNLDAKVLVDINDKIAKSKHQSDLDKQRALLSLLPDIPNLLNKGAIISLSDFSLEMSKGKLNGNLTISLPKDNNNTNPFQLIQKMKGDGRLEISVTLLDDFLKHVYENKYTSQQLAKNQGIVPDKASQTSDDDKTKPKALTTLVSEAQIAPELSPDMLELKIAKQTSDKIKYLEQAGIIVSEGSKYIVVLQFIDGRLMVNNHPFNPMMLQL